MTVMSSGQLAAASVAKLEDLAAAIEVELGRRALAERDGDKTAVARERLWLDDGILRLEFVRCGKGARCRCADGPVHGPYWKLYIRRGGRRSSRYLGKQLPASVVELDDLAAAIQLELGRRVAIFV